MNNGQVKEVKTGKVAFDVWNIKNSYKSNSLEIKSQKREGLRKGNFLVTLKKVIKYVEDTQTFTYQTLLNAQDPRTLALLHTYVLKI